MDSSSQNYPFHQNELKHYDDYLNLFDAEPIEKTLQKGADVIFYTAAPVTNSGKKIFIYYHVDLLRSRIVLT